LTSLGQLNILISLTDSANHKSSFFSTQLSSRIIDTEYLNVFALKHGAIIEAILTDT
jgi:hypothetical protein